MSNVHALGLVAMLAACGGATETSTAQDASASPDSAADDANTADSSPVCTSGLEAGAPYGPVHAPGLACQASNCHGPGSNNVVFTVSGTVYPTVHEPDKCVGSSPPMQVVITDADGGSATLNVNAVGNFYGRTAFVPRLTAKVVANGRENAAHVPQVSGDCNSCHTEQGAQGAPGRITAP